VGKKNSALLKMSHCSEAGWGNISGQEALKADEYGSPPSSGAGVLPVISGEEAPQPTRAVMVDREEAGDGILPDGCQSKLDQVALDSDQSRARLLPLPPCPLRCRKR
jgi:hypothetical protein